jgi:glycosyltransferase involved in cell wall biosynthesis
VQTRFVSHSDCLIVIPAFNEAATVGEVVRGAIGHLPARILVVSDASTDDTAYVAREAGADVLELPVRLGAWGAIQAGLRYARRHRIPHVLTMDADGQHPVDALPTLRAALDSTDVAIGTCPQRLSPAKRVAWAYFRLLTRLRILDVTSGLRGYGPRAIDLLARREASLLDYQDIGVLLLLSGQGLTIEEIPVAMRAREVGKSRVFSSWFSVARYMVHTTVLCVARIRRSLPVEAST